MSKLSQLIDESKRHQVTFIGSSGKTLLELSLFWVILIAIGAPQAMLLALILYLVDAIEVEYDGQPLAFPLHPSEKEPPKATGAF